MKHIILVFLGLLFAVLIVNGVNANDEISEDGKHHQKTCAEKVTKSQLLKLCFMRLPNAFESIGSFNVWRPVAKFYEKLFFTCNFSIR